MQYVEFDIKSSFSQGIVSKNLNQSILRVSTEICTVEPAEKKIHGMSSRANYTDQRPPLVGGVSDNFCRHFFSK
jgi:hypothetical protein